MSDEGEQQSRSDRSGERAESGARCSLARTYVIKSRNVCGGQNCPVD